MTVQIICTIISGIFALISVIFGSIAITIHVRNNKTVKVQKQKSGDNSNNVQVGEVKNAK